MTAMPITQDEMVYIVSHDHTFYALEARNGREMWRTKAQIDRRLEIAPYVTTGSESSYAFIAARNGVIHC